MAKTEVEYLSKNAYAAYLGINEKAVRNAVTQGKIKKGWDTDKQKVIKHLADKEFGFLHKVVKPRPGVSRDKMADKLKSEEVRLKTAESSDNTTSKVRNAKKNIKSEELPDSDDMDELDLTDGISTADLLKKIKITPDLSYAEATRRGAVIQLATDKNKLEEQQGSLVRRADVERALFTLGSQLKKALFSIPPRCADELLGQTSKVALINTLNSELTQVLAEFSNFATIKLDN